MKSKPSADPAPANVGSQHTPGPWSNPPLQPTIWANDGETKIATIADLPWINGNSDWITEEANARLIAAAPEMFEALKQLLPMVESWHEVPPTRANKIRAILAKIGGKA